MSGNKMTLFDIYGDNGLPIDLVILNVIRIVFSTFGILFNASLVFVTAKTKTLKSSCHLLIAFDCLVSSFYQINSWLSITVIFNAGSQFLQIRPCCLEMLPAFLFGFTASFISTYLISFDRLLSVLFPMWSVYLLLDPPPPPPPAPPPTTFSWILATSKIPYLIFEKVL
uniref:Uncharacterized protein n=1 Tax=Meloidogyne enterolobii TaxID=390850 RepID=A0A6V7XP04_MELEN|nr:unnamed protein product [Meloidogyne enterolobii]